MDLMNLFTVLADVPCGDNIVIPAAIANLLKMLVTIIQVVVPIGLVVWGMLDLGKAVFQQKEEDIKKAQQLFLKRIVAAILVFLTVAIVQFVAGIVDEAIRSDIAGCISAIFGSGS